MFNLIKISIIKDEKCKELLFKKYNYENLKFNTVH